MPTRLPPTDREQLDMFRTSRSDGITRRAEPPAGSPHGLSGTFHQHPWRYAMNHMNRPTSAPPTPRLTTVELTWVEKKLEHWIRFGRYSQEQIIDRSHRTVSFNPGSIFAVIRWASNDFGTIVSRIDVLRATAEGEPYTVVPFVRPGAEILLRIYGWSRVMRVLEMIDRVEALDIDPVDAAPDYWGHVANRLMAGHEPRPYTRARHLVWRLRRRLAS
jgi:hypothetical protein